MSDSKITISPRCKCGGVFHTEDDVPTDNSVVTCKACGATIGTYGDFIAEMKRLAAAKARETIQPEIDKLKRTLKGINLKL